MFEPIISVSGIRGIFGRSLRPDNIVRYVKAFADFTKKKRIVIGRDGRFNGDMIEKMVESTLLFSGCEVIVLGVVPTPTVSLAVEELNAGGGIAVTASHNPQMWNGLKFISSKGIFIDKDEVEILKGLIMAEDRNFKEWNKVKQVEYYTDFYKKHIAKVMAVGGLDLKKIRKKNFKVVLDCSNASGSYIIPELLEKLNCDVHKIDCNGSGIFTRKPEPVPENLRSTCKFVKQIKADIGIVVDPDADRLVIITEKGLPFIEENTIVTAVNNVLRNTSAKIKNVVVNLSTTRAVDDIVGKYNGHLYRSPVGEVNVIRKMQKHDAVIGGEGSGGVILPEVHYGRDAMVGIALILNELAETGMPVSEYKSSLPQYFIIKNQVELSNVNPDNIIEYLNQKYHKYNRNNEDGLRIDFDDSWINFRRSNTEPIMRMIAEAPTKQKAADIMNSFLKVITKITG